MLISLHEHFPVRITDWLLSAILFSWGATLFVLDPRTWALPIYSGLHSIAGQTSWAIVATTVGLMRISALFINGAIRPSPHMRCAGAFFSVLIWVQVSLSMMFSTSAGLAIAIYPWLAFADMFNAYRAANDASVADQKAKQRRNSVIARVSGPA